MIIHRADMFGLAQLYQTARPNRRGKTRAYAYLTVPPGKALNEAAAKRLEVMQTLDTLGAGSSLRPRSRHPRRRQSPGRGTSGHIREVGIELYQQLLEEAVESARGGRGKFPRRTGPRPLTSASLADPEEYVADLSVRMGLYRRIGALANQAEIDAFAAE